MELPLEQKSFTICGETANLALRQPIETDLVLPDYCGDVKRILHCGVQPNIHVVTAAGEHIGAEGELVIRVLYVNESDQADCMEQHIPLSVAGRVKALPVGAVFDVRAGMEYINCRALSSRKISVSGTALVHIDVLEKKTETYAAANEMLETLTEEVSCAVLRALEQKTMDLSETLALGEERPAVGRLLRAKGIPVLQSVEATDGKLLIKGKLDVELLYLSGDGSLFMLTHTLPINQVITVPGATAGDDMDVSLTLRALYAEPKRDGNDEAKLIELAAKVSALVKCSRTEVATVVTDCYATNGTLEPTFSERAFPLNISTLSLFRSFSETFETGLDGNMTLLDSTVLQTHNTISGENGKVQLKCSAVLSFLLQDTDGALQYIERTCELTAEEPLDCGADEVNCTPTVWLRLSQPMIDANGIIRLQIDLSAEGALFVMQTERVLTDAVWLEATDRDGQSLVLSFSKEGERLWDIAKRYRTKQSLIQEENALQGDILTEDHMLLIPCAG